MKILIWIYFVLLIIEGALRKWVLPELATPLLIVRDPVLLIIYFQAFQKGIFPQNNFTKIFLGLGIAALFAGLVTSNTLYVALYGFRASFLHIPLIYIMGKLLNWKDIVNIGRVCLLLTIPTAILMVYQFEAEPASWINKTVGDGQLLSSASGHIRPSATFSFSTGPIFFFAIAFAFTLSGYILKTYSKLLLAASTCSIILATAVSGSRGLLLGLLVVLAIFLITTFNKPNLLSGGLKAVLIVAILLGLTSKLEIFQTGVDVFTERVTIASEGEGGLTGFTGRVYSDFIAPFDLMTRAPLFGFGLGLGTNAGATLMYAKREFILAEGEWSRMMLELGPLMGSIYLLLRCYLVCYLYKQAKFVVKYDNVLAVALFGACALNILSGQWGPPTGLGFAVFTGGLCLAASKFKK